MANFPTEMVNLPSKGKLYPKTSPLSKGEIELKYMTAKEEDILSNQAYIESVSPVSTNIVLADVVGTHSVDSVLNHWRDKGLLAVPFGPQTIRLVTHLDLLEDDMILLEEILTSTPK